MFSSQHHSSEPRKSLSRVIARWCNNAPELSPSPAVDLRASAFLRWRGIQSRVAGMRFAVSILAAFLTATLMSAAPARASEVALGESGGIYTVTGEINRSVALQFLVDPGSAVVVIPRAALSRLVANGSVSDSDVVGISIAELADRSLHQTVRIRLRELRIGNEVARDIIAAVAPGLTHALLGQSFLKRFASVTIDNRRRVMILTGQGPGDSGFVAAAPQYPASQYPTTRYPTQYPPSTPSPYYGWPPTEAYSPYGPSGYWR